MTKFNLSEKIQILGEGYKSKKPYILVDLEDVKEFIRLLKLIFVGWNKQNGIYKEIDKLAGSKLNGENKK